VVDATTARVEARRPQVLKTDYRVRLVRTEEQLEEVCRLRMAAYSRRLPDMAEMMREPEPDDTAEGTFLFLATRASDGQAVGTCRVRTNAARPIEVETHLLLPESFRGRLLAQGTRLAVAAGVDTPLVTRLLLKSMYQLCQGAQVAHILVAAEPPRDRFYRAFGFRDVFPGTRFHVESAPNHACALLTFEFARARDQLAASPGFVEFLLDTYCPDIEIFSSLAPSWTVPRMR
jgi:hypothetical protein